MKYTSIALVLMSACSGLSQLDVDQVTVIYGENVTPWSDTPEYIRAMKNSSAPAYVWQGAVVELKPGFEPLDIPEDPFATAAYSNETDLIQIRVRYDSAADDQLAHEFAHRWDYLSGDQDPDDVHDDSFKEKWNILFEAGCKKALRTNVSCGD